LEEQEGEGKVIYGEQKFKVEISFKSIHEGGTNGVKISVSLNNSWSGSWSVKDNITTFKL
jgi:hypothetical protein